MPGFRPDRHAALPRLRERHSRRGKHLLALINDILDLSKAEAGKLDLHLDTVDVSEVIAECAHLMRERARNSGLEISIACGPDLPALEVDGLR